jgi:kinesin family protein C1
MQGSGAGPMRGIIPRSLERVGSYKRELEEQGWTYSLKVSYLEIYNETIRDLLRERGTDELKHEIKRDARGSTTVSELTVVDLADACDSTEVEAILEKAARMRSVSCTDMNEHSSRSHSVFTLYLSASNERTRSAVNGSLSLVDLAGSERISRSGVQGARLKESISINKSLSSLADVFTALANKQGHVPYRNSKLTYLLQPALSGDGKALMILNVSPTSESVPESLCSLR